MNDWKPPYIEEMMKALERDEVYHCIIFNISWNMLRNLPEEYLPIIRTTLNKFAEVNNWTMHRLRVDKDQVFMTVQVNPEILIDDAVESMQKIATDALQQKFKNVNNTPIWRKDFWAETTDKHTLDQCKHND